MLTWSKRTAALIAACTLSLGACAGSKDEPQATPTKTDVVMTTDYVVKTTGDIGLATSGKLPVRMLAIRASDPQFRGVTLLSVGPKEPVVADDMAFRVAFDLTNYTGDGKYKIKAGSPRDLLKVAEAGGAAEAPDQSNVLVQLWPTGDVQSQPEVFDKALVPCPLETSDGGRRGTLRCPQLTNDSGKVFSLEMRWGKK